MDTKIPNDEQMNEVFKTLQSTGLQMIPADHEEHQIAMLIGKDPTKQTKYLVTFETFT
jgi:hypothetical protein